MKSIYKTTVAPFGNNGCSYYEICIIDYAFSQ